MGWFSEQINERKENDRRVLEEAYSELSDAVTGQKLSAVLAGKAEQSQNAIEEILKFYHVKSRELPDNIQDLNGQLEYLMRPHGIMRRTVHLQKGWYKDAIGAMLAVRKSDQSAVALIPTGLSGYTFFDRETAKQVAVSKENEDLFFTEAIAFYKPFPMEKLSMGSLLRFIAQNLSVSDYVFLGLAALGATLLGMLAPMLSKLLMGPVIQNGTLQPLLAIMSFMICVSVSTLLLRGVHSLLVARIKTKLEITVQAATMSRILSLPASFFRGYSSGDLASRANHLNNLCSMLASAVLSTGLTSIFSLVYIGQIFTYAPALVVPAVFVILLTLGLSLVTIMVQMKITQKSMEINSKRNGMSYSMISGVQKLKLSGAEKRAFAKWGKLLAKEAKLQYDPPAIIKYNSALAMLIATAGQLVLYYRAVVSAVPVADYYAFNVAYGMVSGAFLSLTQIAIMIANIRPILKMAAPIMETVPEISQGKQVVTRLSGGIELNNVSFRYNENMPMVLDDLSLKIRPGQYVAVVGSTGCGKSTLMRILLGLETPQKGAVYYDGKDLAALDLKSLRRKIGVVLQDGKLFQGDIYSNIVISAPWLTQQDAWEAAELSGMAEDIRRMPMGMHTMISEGSGGISGGQRQRLMIARAIAPKPRILMFDEATSALDNITQKKVSESLDHLKCTRIVIAHRLSTIRQCDRILYLEKGKIVEEGTYEDLIRKNGKFAELVARQRLDGAEQQPVSP